MLRRGGVRPVPYVYIYIYISIYIYICITPISGQWALTLEDTTMAQPSRQDITFGTFNCNGFKSFHQSAEAMLSNCDILCLQETMLTKQECSLLNSFHDN